MASSEENKAKQTGSGQTKRFWLPLPTLRFTILLATLSFIVGLSTLNRGLQNDDYLHRSLILAAQQEGKSSISVIHDLFVFFGGQDAELVTLPWWADPDLKIRFWRPLSSLSHYLDYQLWPNNIKAMHLHSIMWYVLFVLLAYAFLNTLLPPVLSQLAALLVCLDFSHFANISWLANRNSLIAGCLMLACSIYFIQWHQRNKNFLLVCSLLLFVSALLAAESSAAVLLVIVAYAYFFNNIKQRAISPAALIAVLLLFVSTAALFSAFYQLNGYGISNSGLYLNPAQAPFVVVWDVFHKVPVHFFSQLFVLEGFYNTLSTPLKSITSLFLTLLLILFFYALRSAPKQQQLPFFITCTVLALLPASLFSLIDMRFGLYASVFSSAILAIALICFSKKTGALRYLFFLLLALHFLINPMQWIYTAKKDLESTEPPFSLLNQIRKHYPQQTVYILNHPTPFDLFYFYWHEQATHLATTEKHEPTDFSIAVLINSYADFSISMENSNCFTLQSDNGFVFNKNDLKKAGGDQKLIDSRYANISLNSIYLDNNYRFTAQSNFYGKKFITTIVTTNKEGLAQLIRFCFEQALLSDTHAFLIWDQQQKTYQIIDMSSLLYKKQTKPRSELLK